MSRSSAAARHGAQTVTAQQDGGPGAASPTLGGAKRAAYRDNVAPPSRLRPANIMFDPRVVRGSTHAAPIVAPSVLAEQKRREEDAVDRKRRKTDTLRKLQADTDARRTQTPEPVPGRLHGAVQTEEVLEIISDRPVEADIATQTEAARDRPSTPLFIPAPGGIDAATQIEEGDLFDFDYEVAPILDALVGRTLEQAVTEIVREDELAAIARAQAEFNAVRDAQLVEALQLEAELQRRAQEKAARLEEERRRLAREQAVAAKVAATALARRLVSGVRAALLVKLEAAGFFYDPLQREIQTLVLPGILAALEAHTALRAQVAAVLANELIGAALTRGAESFSTFSAAQAAEQERLRTLAAERAALEIARATKALEEAAAKLAAEAAAAAAEEEGDVEGAAEEAAAEEE